MSCLVNADGDAAMPFCCRSQAAVLRQETKDLEQEQGRLQSEAVRLETSIQQSETSRQQILEEVQQVNRHAEQREALALSAQHEHHRLSQEVAALSSFTPVFETSTGEVFSKPPPVNMSLAGNDAPAAAAVWLEAEQLMRALGTLQSEMGQSEKHSTEADVHRVASSLPAEAAAAELQLELRMEIAERKAALAMAESAGCELAREHDASVHEEAPYIDWVQHVGHELRLAQDEYSELSQALAQASDERTDLRREELAALPLRQVGIDATQVGWLQEREHENVALKAVLLEEIAAHRSRRSELLAQASIYSQEARLQNEEADVCSDRTHILIPGAYPVSRTSHSGPHSFIPALGLYPQPKQLPGLARTNPKVKTAKSTTAPSPIKPRCYKRSSQVSAGVPASPTYTCASTFPCPSTPFVRLMAAGRPWSPSYLKDVAWDEDRHLHDKPQVLLPDLPSGSSSGHEDAGGAASYWDSLDDDESIYL